MPAPAFREALEVLRERDFRYFATARFAAQAAQGLFTLLIGWHVYELTGSAAALGGLGLIRFLVALVLSLYAGAIADSFDRKRILLFTQVVPLACSAVLFATSASHTVSISLIYVLVLISAVASSFEGPARQAILPALVSRERFQRAITFNQIVGGVAGPTGAAIGATLISMFDVSGAYAGHVALLFLSALGIALLRPRPIEGARREVSLEAIREGLVFVFRRQTLLGPMTLDLFAVIFAGATALLPIYAKDILHAGPGGLAVLTAASDVGSLLTASVLVLLPPVQRAGRALMFAIAAFGLGTIAFGLSRSFPLSVALYTLVGAADQIGLVMRHTTVQMTTPDALRGRVSSVASLFSNSSNRLGDFESGFLAAATSPTFAVVSGGIACVAIVGIVALTMPNFRRYRLDTALEAETPAPVPV